MVKFEAPESTRKTGIEGAEGLLDDLDVLMKFSGGSPNSPKFRNRVLAGRELTLNVVFYRTAQEQGGE